MLTPSHNSVVTLWEAESSSSVHSLQYCKTPGRKHLLESTASLKRDLQDLFDWLIDFCILALLTIDEYLNEIWVNCIPVVHN